MASTFNARAVEYCIASSMSKFWFKAISAAFISLVRVVWYIFRPLYAVRLKKEEFEFSYLVKVAHDYNYRVDRKVSDYACFFPVLMLFRKFSHASFRFWAKRTSRKIFVSTKYMIMHFLAPNLLCFMLKLD